jgi:hypothetical protein
MFKSSIYNNIGGAVFAGTKTETILTDVVKD